MSWVATAGGVLLGPIVGGLAARFLTDAVKPTGPSGPSNVLFLGAAVQAAAAVGAHMLSEHTHEENLHAFAYGATWGSGISSGLNAAGGLYLKTDAGKKSPLNKFLSPAENPPGPVAGALTQYGSPSKGGGLLAILTAAKQHGYA